MPVTMKRVRSRPATIITRAELTAVLLQEPAVDYGMAVIMAEVLDLRFGAKPHSALFIATLHHVPEQSIHNIIHRALINLRQKHLELEENSRLWCAIHSRWQEKQNKNARGTTKSKSYPVICPKCNKRGLLSEERVYSYYIIQHSGYVCNIEKLSERLTKHLQLMHQRNQEKKTKKKTIQRLTTCGSSALRKLAQIAFSLCF